MASTYDPLQKFLMAGHDSTITLSFDQVEIVLGRQLPPSAYNHTLWWLNDDSSHQHCQSWNRAGYDARPDLRNKRVTFYVKGTRPSRARPRVDVEALIAEYSGAANSAP